MSTDCSQQLTFWNLGKQQVTVDFAGGRVVTDAGVYEADAEWAKAPKGWSFREVAGVATDSRRAPYNNTIVRDIVGYNATCANQRVLANRYVAENR